MQSAWDAGRNDGECGGVMKQRGITATVILVLTVIIAGIFAINIREDETQVTKKRTKVGMIFNGSCTDNSWGQSQYEGMKKCEAELNLDVEYRENVPETKESLTVFEQLIADGCTVIVSDSYGYGKWQLQCAKKHPEVFFFHAGGVQESDNMATYLGRIYQMRYLSGIVAGMQTESDRIGYVAAFPIDEVNRGISAFAIGVRLVNPKAKVYVEWSRSWTDDTDNREATERLLARQKKIDVITMHCNSLSPLAVADEHGIWSIGYNMDNSEKYPDSFLTAPVWNWENFFKPRILECLQGKFKGIHYWEGINTGVVALAPFGSQVKDGIKEAVEEQKKKLERGMFDVFYGPVRDQNGKLRIREGESMTDEAMLSSFDWYAEGVVTDGVQ